MVEIIDENASKQIQEAYLARNGIQGLILMSDNGDGFGSQFTAGADAPPAAPPASGGFGSMLGDAGAAIGSGFSSAGSAVGDALQATGWTRRPWSIRTTPRRS